MGLESFRIELCGGSATYREVDKTIRTLPNVKLDQQSFPMKGSTYYILNDTRHVLEIELLDAPVRLSCRFTLCHPPTVDSFFLERVSAFMCRFAMKAKICDDTDPENKHWFTLDDADFASSMMRAIAVRRSEWIANFGSEQFAATTDEVHERIILPRCQPVVKLPILK